MIRVRYSQGAAIAQSKAPVEMRNKIQYKPLFLLDAAMFQKVCAKIG
jgi:hypothetical protein